jgi:hypothetical protein
MKHLKNCDCYNCVNCFDQKIGRFVHADFAVPKYKSPGQIAYATEKPGAYIGRVMGYNTKGNFIKINSGATEFWIYNDSKLTYSDVTPVLDPSKMTLAEKASVIKTVANATPYGPPKVITNAAVDIGTGVIETSESILDLTGFLGRNLKYIVYGVMVLAVIWGVMQIKKIAT